jgi:hypothetical protein
VDLQQADDQHDQEQHRGGGRGEGGAVHLSLLDPDVVLGQVRRSLRTPAGHHVEQPEHRGQHPDHGGDDDELDGAGQAGNDDVADRLRGRGAVDPGGVQQFGVQGGEAGEEDHQRHPERGPDVHADDGEHGHVRIAEPVDRTGTGGAQHGVQRAVVRQQQVEDRADDHR